jgi:hypothetical protein
MPKARIHRKAVLLRNSSLAQEVKVVDEGAGMRQMPHAPNTDRKMHEGAARFWRRRCAHHSAAGAK